MRNSVVFGKGITESNSHLVGEDSKRSISNSYQVKNEFCRHLAVMGTKSEETKLHTRATKSRATVFFATAAPWEPYFKCNPRAWGKEYDW
ncbi:hypothetical protein TNCV_3745191 [Trichonephila clavipes]|nr:hypothetical protein TNCV_3745191 [Trichonephila clavipes]